MGSNGHDFTGARNPNYRTGLARKGIKNSLYNSWCGLKQRCLNPNHPKFARYGGRGIGVHHDWLTIEGFRDWAIANGWESGLTIDRIDNDGHYEPMNCRWVTNAENSRKKSSTKLTRRDADNIRARLTSGANIADLASEYGVSDAAIWFIKEEITHTDDYACSAKLKLRAIERQRRKK